MKTPRACPRRIVSTGWLFAVSFLAAFSSLPTMVAGQRASTVSARHNSLSHQGKPTRLKQGRSTSLVEGAARPRIVQASRGLPLAFEPNVGQTDPEVRFLSRGNHYALFLTGTDAVLKLRAGSSPDGRNSTKPDFSSPKKAPTTSADALRMKLVQGNPHPQLVGLDPLPGRNNYFIGKDPEKWHRNVPTYSRVKYSEVYPGVDLVYYGNQRQLEYDFIVRPGADPKTIQLAVAAVSDRRSAVGTPPVQIDAAGDLVIPTLGGEVRFHKPVIYQPQDTPAGARQSVEGKFVLLAENRVGFEVAAYDRLKPLIIDPTMLYATFLGGSGGESADDVAVDGSGNAYLTGYTSSTDFPTTNSGMNNGFYDVFVTKLNAAGSSRVYSTYLGGGDFDQGFGITVDASGNAYLTGRTSSTDFPATTGDTSCGTDGTCNGGSGDVFVAKLNSSGTLAYATYLGGSTDEFGLRIRVDSNGNAYVIGYTNSGDFPVANGFQTVCSSCADSLADAFVAKLNAAGSSVLYSTFLGGKSSEVGRDLALDASGNVWVIGQTASPDFPTTSNALQQENPDSGNFSDAFLAKINAAASGPSSLLYSSYIGSDGNDFGLGIALDGSGNVYIAGEFNSSQAPPGSTGFDTTPNGSADAVVAKLNPTATDFIYFTFLGGADYDSPNAIAVDSGGNAYVTGETISSDFPTASPLQKTNKGGGADAFLTKLSADGKSLVYSSYLGGTSFDNGLALALDSTRNAYIVGFTRSPDFPATTGSAQESIDGTEDAFAAKVALAGPDLSLNPSSLFFGIHLVGSTTTTTRTLTVTNTGNANLNITAMTIGGTNAGDFTLDSSSTCSTSTPVAPNGTCTAAVKFKPGAVGARTAALAIASDAVNGSVGLKGFGGTLSFAAASGSQTTATVAAGGTATYSLKVNAPLGSVVTLSCTGAPQASTCTTSTGIVTIALFSPNTFTVSVRTTARSLILPPSPEGPNVPGWKLPQSVPLKLMWLLALLTLAGIATRRRRARYVLATALLWVLMWGACGGDNTPSTPRGTPAGTYNLTVSGTAEGVTKTVGLILNVN